MKYRDTYNVTTVETDTISEVVAKRKTLQGKIGSSIYQIATKYTRSNTQVAEKDGCEEVVGFS